MQTETKQERDSGPRGWRPFFAGGDALFAAGCGDAVNRRRVVAKTKKARGRDGPAVDVLEHGERYGAIYSFFRDHCRPVMGGRWVVRRR